MLDRKREKMANRMTVNYKKLGSSFTKMIPITDAQLLLKESQTFGTMTRWTNGSGLLEVSEDTPYRTFHLFLRLLQTKDVFSALIDQSTETIVELNYLADKYNCRNLDLDTTSVFLSKLRPENALSMCEATINSIWNPNLFNSAQKVFEDQTSEALSGPVLDHSMPVLAKLLAADKLSLKSEFELFAFIDRWWKKTKLRSMARELLSHVRLLTLTTKEFLDGPALSDLLSDEEKKSFFRYKETGVLSELYSLNKSTVSRCQRSDLYSQFMSIYQPYCYINVSCNSAPITLTYQLAVNVSVRVQQLYIELSNSELSAAISKLKVIICDSQSFVLSSVKKEGFTSVAERLQFEGDVFLLAGEDYRLSIVIWPVCDLPLAVFGVRVRIPFSSSLLGCVLWKIDQLSFD